MDIYGFFVFPLGQICSTLQLKYIFWYYIRFYPEYYLYGTYTGVCTICMYNRFVCERHVAENKIPSLNPKASTFFLPVETVSRREEAKKIDKMFQQAGILLRSHFCGAVYVLGQANAILLTHQFQGREALSTMCFCCW